MTERETYDFTPKRRIVVERKTGPAYMRIPAGGAGAA